MHKQVTEATVDRGPIESLNAFILANTVSYDCELESNGCAEAEELFDLLTSPHIEVELTFSSMPVACMCVCMYLCLSVSVCMHVACMCAYV